jgi:hypothetical protein
MYASHYKWLITYNIHTVVADVLLVAFKTELYAVESVP